MDDRDEPDTNVVHLRPQADRDEVELATLGHTIFADEDDVGTFSRGNLVPPATSRPPGQEDSKPVADSFFDRYRDEDAGEPTPVAVPVGDQDDTVAYFDQLGARSPAEMAELAVPQSVVATMPGSARLPVEPARRSGERRRRLAAGSASALWVTGPRSLRLSAIGARARALPRLLLPSVKGTARPAFLGILGVLAVGGAAVAAILVPSAPSTAPHEAAKQAAVGSRQKAVAPAHPRQSTHTRVKATRAHTTQRHIKPRHRPPPARTNARSTDHARASAPTITSATGTAAPRGVEPTSVSSASPSNSQTTDSGTAAQTPSSSTQTPSSSAASQSSGSQNPPAFGANGTLGPGSSPDG